VGNRTEDDIEAAFGETLRRSEPDVAPSSERAKLLSTLEHQVIPRLVLAHCGDAIANGMTCAPGRHPPTPGEVAELARLAAGDERERAFDLVAGLARDGLPVEQLLLDLITPAARLLGQHWVEDERSFAEVTVGLSVLHRLVTQLGPSFSAPLLDRGLVLLTAAPGEQHTLGLCIVAEFFRRGGWAVQVEPKLTDDELVDLVRRERLDMLGFTVARETTLKPLGRLIRSVKKASANPELALMVGGTAPLEAFAEKHAVYHGREVNDAVRWLSERGTLKNPSGSESTSA